MFLVFFFRRINEPVSRKSYRLSTTRYLISCLALGNCCTSAKTMRESRLCRYGGVKDGQLGKEQIQVCAFVEKKIQNVLGGVAEIDKDVTFVFLLGEQPCNIAFPHTTGAVDKQGGLSVASMFPCDKLVVELSFQHGIPPNYE